MHARETGGCTLGASRLRTRGIEVYRNKVILYGCGDLINDYEGIESDQDEYRSELVLMYFPTLDRAIVLQPDGRIAVTG